MRKTTVMALIPAMALMLTACQVEYANEMTTPAEENTTEAETTDSILRVRYCDDRYTGYLEYCKKEYEKSNGGISVEIQLVSSSDYIQGIKDDSVSGKEIPDVYIAGNSDLSVAYLAGLASVNTSDEFSLQNYSKAALDSCSSNGSLVAYPLSYSTSFLVYNADYLSEEDVKTFEAIKTYSNNADFTSEDSAQIDKIFGCDLNGIFGNYGFVGSGIDLGGEFGDDNTSVSICNDKTLEAAQEYLSLVDYFHLNMDSSHEDCLDKFSQGVMLATIMYTDDVSLMADWNVNYRITEVPDYNGEVAVKPLSVTKSLVVNPYSSKQSEAAGFAELAAVKCADKLYEYTGMMSAGKRVKHDNAELDNIYASYEKSAPQNKLLYGEQAYPRIEIALHNIVAGNDMGEEFKNVDEYMKTQME